MEQTKLIDFELKHNDFLFEQVVSASISFRHLVAIDQCIHMQQRFE